MTLTGLYLSFVASTSKSSNCFEAYLHVVGTVLPWWMPLPWFPTNLICSSHKEQTETDNLEVKAGQSEYNHFTSHLGRTTRTDVVVLYIEVFCLAIRSAV